eukprot:scaffold110906_cov33-Tisochrysis_lutea.AAC.3
MYISVHGSLCLRRLEHAAVPFIPSPHHGLEARGDSLEAQNKFLEGNKKMMLLGGRSLARGRTRPRQRGRPARPLRPATSCARSFRAHWLRTSYSTPAQAAYADPSCGVEAAVPAAALLQGCLHGRSGGNGIHGWR